MRNDVRGRAAPCRVEVARAPAARDDFRKCAPEHSCQPTVAEQSPQPLVRQATVRTVEGGACVRGAASLTMLSQPSRHCGRRTSA